LHRKLSDFHCEWSDHRFKLVISRSRKLNVSKFGRWAMTIISRSLTCNRENNWTKCTEKPLCIFIRCLYPIMSRFETDMVGHSGACCSVGLSIWSIVEWIIGCWCLIVMSFIEQPSGGLWIGRKLKWLDG
jgi:hypothetical protein